MRVQFRQAIARAHNQAAAGQQRFAESIGKNGASLCVEIEEQVTAKDQVVAGLLFQSAGVCKVPPLETDAAAQFIAHGPMVALKPSASIAKIVWHIGGRAWGKGTT